MRLLWHRGCMLITTAGLVGLFAACALLGLGVFMHAHQLPPVLLHNTFIWVGDRCRAEQDFAGQHTCPRIYRLDLFVHGTPLRHYVVLEIPLDGAYQGP